MIQIVSFQNSSDTIKFGINLNEIGVNYDEIAKKASISISKPEYGSRKTYIVSNPDHGFNSLVLQPDGNKGIIQVSAKILGNDYRQGINLSNIEAVTDTINRTNLIDISTDTVLNSDVYRIDANQTIELSDTPKKAVQALQVLTAKGYKFNPYPSGIDMRHQAKSRKEQLVCYSKRSELLMASNKDFITAYPKALASFTDNSFRMESPVTKQSLMREVYGVNTKEFGLGDLLGAKVNPVHQMFKIVSSDYDEIITKINRMADIAKESGKSKYTMTTVYKMSLIELCEYDLNKVMAVHSRHSKGNLSAKKKEYRDLIGLMKAEQGIEQGHDTLIHEIGHKLSQAV